MPAGAKPGLLDRRRPGNSPAQSAASTKLLVLKAFDRFEAGRNFAVAHAGQMQDDGFRNAPLDFTLALIILRRCLLRRLIRISHEAENGGGAESATDAPC